MALLLYVAGAHGNVFIGGLLLWVAFLAYLETRHAHEYRTALPKWLWGVLAILGLLLYGRIEGIFFLLASYFYTHKNKKSLGLYSPLLRGLQSVFLVGGLLSYSHSLVWVAFLLTFLRNVVGDFRDVEKDMQAGMKTVPMLIGWKKNVPYAHLIGILVTTYVWWSYSTVSFSWLVLIWVIEVATYNLTSR